MNPRVAAHTIIAAAGRGTFADRTAEEVLPRVGVRDRGLALEIAYGVLRLRARLDCRIDALTDRPLKRIDADLLDWLRAGIYELTEMRTPAHAAVNENVKQARRAGAGAATGFLNAVLRRAAKEDATPFPERREDPVGFFSTYGSHPEWLVKRWLSRWKEHEVAALVEHGNSPPPVVIRMLEPASEAAVSAACPEGVRLEAIGAWPGSYRLAAGSPADALAGLRAVIQDPAASAVVDCLGDGLRPPVYDACAAPGTKTMGLAARSSGPVVAADVSRRRLERVRAAAGRLGVEILPVVADGRRPAVGSAATVLADVPCTGTGVLRRRPDARWRIGPESLRELVSLQAEILDGCARIVDEGGMLVYSTCSLEPEENEMQVDAFLRRTPGFQRDALDSRAFPGGTITASGDLSIRPWVHGTDGSYAARLRRVA